MNQGQIVKDVKYWFRWVAVLPGGFLAGILATFPMHWILYLTLAHKGASLFGIIEFENGVDIRPIEELLTPFVIAFTYILVGYEIAPKYKFKTAIVLLVPYIFLCLFVSFIMLFKGGVYRGNIIFSWPPALMAAAGASLGLYCAWRNFLEKK
jgi:hypothetical protein